MNSHLKILAVPIANSISRNSLNSQELYTELSDQNPSCCRPEPYGAAVWLLGEDQPNAQFNIQHREGHSENVASPCWELRVEEGRNWWHDRWHAAVWPHQHSRLQHPRTAHQTGTNWAVGCCRVSVCRYPGVGTSNACSWTSSDFLMGLAGACAPTTPLRTMIPASSTLETLDKRPFLLHNHSW